LPRAVEFLGGRVRYFDRRESERFAPDLQQIEDGLRAGVRAVFLSDLHNPSGLRLGDDVRRSLVKLTGRHGASLIVDEVYLDAAYLAGRAPLQTAATLAPDVTVTNSLTKVYGLGPVRAGWLVGSPQVAERARNACDYLMVNNASPAMNLGLRALSNIARLEQRSRDVYTRAWPIVHEWLERRPHLFCPGNDGAVFVLIRLPDGLGAAPFVDHLVRRHDTLVVPGGFFQLPGHVRLGFAVEPALLREGLRRIDAALCELAGTNE
jgi:aspartate/methionine/tyrosine aminotransferase